MNFAQNSRVYSATSRSKMQFLANLRGLLCELRANAMVPILPVPSWLSYNNSSALVYPLITHSMVCTFYSWWYGARLRCMSAPTSTILDPVSLIGKRSTLESLMVVVNVIVEYTHGYTWISHSFWNDQPESSWRLQRYKRRTSSRSGKMGSIIAAASRFWPRQPV